MRVTDPQTLRGMSHPLRLDLIELLGTLGPATAATCARHLGSSQASCSFHLRQLAKYGFVQQAPDSGDRRERPWRLTDIEQSWSSDAGAAADELERVFVQREADRIIRWGTRRGRETDEWRQVAYFGGATVPVTPAEVEAIAEGMRAVLAPYVERLSDSSTVPPGARFVRFVLGGTPLDLTGPTPDVANTSSDRYPRKDNTDGTDVA